jgi:chitinase
LSLGGWGGANLFPGIFLRRQAALNLPFLVKTILEQYQADGLDLDWNIHLSKAFRGISFCQKIASNFTALVHELRNVLGKHYEISFAAGGLYRLLEHSIDMASGDAAGYYVKSCRTT